jgi:glucose-6-phosphate isomerase
MSPAHAPVLSNTQYWERYRKYLCHCPSLGLTLDISRMGFSESFFVSMAPFMTRAFAAMDKLEAGAIANPDENRMVGHYWLRAPSRAPRPELRQEIETTLQNIKDFARQVHSGAVRPPSGKKFKNVLVIGIGGSALGPQFVADALGSPQDKMAVYFFDNTDPDGMDRVIHALGKDLNRTLAVVISKSGGTKETRNGMLAAAAAYRAAGLDFAQHAVAVTGPGSELDQTAVHQAWLQRFPMWDWVGGRTAGIGHQRPADRRPRYG